MKPRWLLPVIGVAVLFLPGDGASQGDAAVIRQQGIQFTPARVRIPAGGRVTFENRDPFGHNVYSPTPGAVFDIGLQDPDAETTVSFPRTGVYEIRCRIHPRMRAEITVE